LLTLLSLPLGESLVGAILTLLGRAAYDDAELAQGAGLLHAATGVRVVVAAVACVAFGTLLVADGRSLSTREVLLRESASLLPPEARILNREYREQR
jgi:hypothetical protein